MEYSLTQLLKSQNATASMVNKIKSGKSHPSQKSQLRRMPNWKEYKLGEVALIVDSLHKTPTYSDKGFPMVRVTDIKSGFLKLDDTFRVSREVFDEFSKKHKPKKGDIVMSRVGTYGISSLVTNETNFCLGQNTLFIIPKEDPYFLYYFLNSRDAKNQIEELATGSTQKTISLRSIKEIVIKLPGLPTQTAIAEILSSLDDKIEINNQINKELEALAQALFKQWFIDFEFPNENGQPYKSSGGEMAESELGEIPKGWKSDKLGNLTKTTSGGTPSRSKMEYYENGNILWVKSKELNNSVIFDTEEKINEDALKNSSAKLLPPYSILIAMYGATVGQIALITEEATCNQAICAVLPSDNLPYTYNYLFLQNYRGLFSNLAVGSAQQNISQELIKNIPMALPQKKMMLEFHSATDSLLKMVESNCRENNELQSLRDSLLPRLISGELEVSEVLTEKVM